MAVSYVFTGGRYNGSSVSVLGRNPTGASIREVPILGGTGAFRFARGYALTSTYSADFKNGVAIVEYNMYVLHH
ncbi:hypothetical protein MLD38_031580 [Melastoma candidum]|nr:hypothetical protein MLD38_031580 [Melastoma candidum]